MALSGFYFWHFSTVGIFIAFFSLYAKPLGLSSLEISVLAALHPRRVVNATGIVLHTTHRGRSPSDSRLAQPYCNPAVETPASIRPLA